MLAGVQHGISVAQIYRAANNPLMDRMIARYRGDQGEFVSKGRRSRAAAITALRRGTHLGLLADQKMNDGIPVPFFGRPAMIAPALAVCDVLPLRVERLDGARFRVTVFPPLPLPRSGEPPANVAALMAEVNATLEACSPRPPRAMALGAPTLAGLLLLSQSLSLHGRSEPEKYEWDPGRTTLTMAGANYFGFGRSGLSAERYVRSICCVPSASLISQPDELSRLDRSPDRNEPKRCGK